MDRRMHLWLLPCTDGDGMACICHMMQLTPTAPDTSADVRQGGSGREPQRWRGRKGGRMLLPP